MKSWTDHILTPGDLHVNVRNTSSSRVSDLDFCFLSSPLLRLDRRLATGESPVHVAHDEGGNRRTLSVRQLDLSFIVFIHSSCGFQFGERDSQGVLGYLNS